MNKTVARIVDPAVRIFEAKEPALVNAAVTGLAALGGHFGLHLDAAEVAVETTIVSTIGNVIVRQLVHATGIADLPSK